MVSEDEARRSIYELDLDEVASAVRAASGWDDARVEAAVRRYRDYLWICYLEGGRAFPMLDRDADQVWHMHILHSSKYRADCDRIFGRQLDHVPSRGRLPEAEIEAGQRRWEEVFGTRLETADPICISIM